MSMTDNYTSISSILQLNTGGGGFFDPNAHQIQHNSHIPVQMQMEMMHQQQMQQQQMYQQHMMHQHMLHQQQVNNFSYQQQVAM